MMTNIEFKILDAATLNGQEIIVVNVFAVVVIILAVTAIVALCKTFDFHEICDDKEEKNNA